MIAVIQLINKLNGLRFGRPDEELAGAFAAQLAVCIENLRGLEDVNLALKAPHIDRTLTLTPPRTLTLPLTLTLILTLPLLLTLLLTLPLTLTLTRHHTSRSSVSSDS